MSSLMEMGSSKFSLRSRSQRIDMGETETLRGQIRKLQTTRPMDPRLNKRQYNLSHQLTKSPKQTTQTYTSYSWTVRDQRATTRHGERSKRGRMVAGQACMLPRPARRISVAAVRGAEAAAAEAAALAVGESLGPADVGAVGPAHAGAPEPVALRLARPRLRHRHRPHLCTACT